MKRANVSNKEMLTLFSIARNIKKAGTNKLLENHSFY